MKQKIWLFFQDIKNGAGLEFRPYKLSLWDNYFVRLKVCSHDQADCKISPTTATSLF